MDIIISVVICTYNRSNLLRDVLHTLTQQTLDNQLYQIIVIDNNSSDDTKAVAEEFCRQNPNFHYCYEPRQGLSYARNRGWQEAIGDYVAYTDDDCRIPARWLETAKQIIRDTAPAVFGGPYYAFYNSPKPKWYKDEYGSYEPSKEAHLIKGREYLVGGNIFIRRDIIKESGGFLTDLGMTGNKIAYGEEVELVNRIRQKNPANKAYYDPELYVYHLVRPEKMNLFWGFRSHFIGNIYYYRVLELNRPTPLALPDLLITGAKLAVKIFLALTYKLVLRDKVKYPYLHNYFYENLSGYIGASGMLFEQFRSLIKRA